MQVRNIGFQKSLLNKLVRLSNKLELEAESVLKVSFSLTFSQFKVLESLSSADEITQRQLASIIGVTPAVITKQAEVLADRGLLEQKQNPVSKREKILVITDKGRKAALDAGREVVRSQNNVLKQIDVQSETALLRILDKIEV